MKRLGDMEKSEEKVWDAELVELAEKQITDASKRIEFYLTEYSVELLADKMRKKDFVVPDYQRDFTWEAERKSRFIESLLMGLPIPFLFFWEMPDSGRLEIVDGSQRLRTIEEFLLGDLALGELEQLSHLKGFRFRDFSESRQRKIKNRSIRGIVLNEHADEAARFDLFDRINTGSKIANKAEVRRGALKGPFQELVIDLAKDPNFVNLTPLSEKLVKERTREELVTRFFAYGDGLEKYRDQVSSFLFDYTKQMNSHFEKNPNDKDLYRERFMRTMKFVERTFSWGFRRTEKGTTTPKSRFEAIALGSFLALQQRPDLIVSPDEVEKWLESKGFTDVVRADGANAIKRLKERMHFVRDRLLGN